jgi:gliotoxin/aspirochlorine biosynthesis thioredoxin reductase
MSCEPIESTLAVSRASGYIVDERHIACLEPANDENGNDGVDVVFTNGERTFVGFLVHKPRTVLVSSALIEALGVEVVKESSGTVAKKNKPFNESNVRGVFIAGDAGTSVKQVTIAMAAGTLAAMGVTFQLGAEEGDRALRDTKSKV